MSNIGKQPVNIPDGVNVDIKGNNISIKGKLGELNTNFNPIINIEVIDNVVYIKRPNDIITIDKDAGIPNCKICLKILRLKLKF